MHPLLVRAATDERSRRALTRSEVFFPYFAMRVHYDNRRTRVALRASGIRTAPLRTYFVRLLEFALAAQWGRRQISRVSAARGVAFIGTPAGACAAGLDRRLVLAE